MNFFPKKTNEILKKLLELIQSYEDVPFSGPKWPISPEQLFWYKPLLLLSSIIVQNFKKFLQRIHRYDDAAFLGPKWSISPKQIFIWKIVIAFLIYLLDPFLVQNLKEILPVDPEIWGCAIFGSKMAHFPKWEFSQKTFQQGLFLSFMPI